MLGRPPRVLISTCVDAKLRQNITKTIERLGGIIMTSADDFSVFVTLDAAPGKSDCGFTKSKNALSALAAGTPHSPAFRCHMCTFCHSGRKGFFYSDWACTREVPADMQAARDANKILQWEWKPEHPHRIMCGRER